MPLQITCPTCSKTLKVSDEHRGKKVKCPSCASVLSVGGGPSSSTPVPAQPAPAQPVPAQPAPVPQAASAATLTITCPCSTKLKVSETSRGKQIQCPKCRRRLKVPAAPSTSGATTTPAAPLPAAASPAVASPFDAAPTDNPFDFPAPATPVPGAPVPGVPVAGAPVAGAPVPGAADDPFANLPGTPAPAAGGDMWSNLPSTQPAPMSPAAMSPAAAPAASPAAKPGKKKPSRDDAALAAAGGYSASVEERQVQASGGDDDDGFNRFHLALIAMVFIGPIMTYFSYQSKMRYERLVKSGVKVDGVVIDGWERRGRRSRSYYLEVAFKTESGQAITEEYSVGSAFYDKTDLAAIVPVAYDAEDPSESIIVGGSSDSSFTVILGIGMTVIGVLGTAWVIYSNVAIRT